MSKGKWKIKYNKDYIVNEITRVNNIRALSILENLHRYYYAKYAPIFYYTFNKSLLCFYDMKKGFDINLFINYILPEHNVKVSINEDKNFKNLSIIMNKYYSKDAISLIKVLRDISQFYADKKEAIVSGQHLIHKEGSLND